MDLVEPPCEFRPENCALKNPKPTASGAYPIAREMAGAAIRLLNRDHEFVTWNTRIPERRQFVGTGESTSCRGAQPLRYRIGKRLLTLVTTIV